MQTDWTRCPHLSGIKAELSEIESHSKRTFETVKNFTDKIDQRMNEQDARMDIFEQWKMRMKGFIQGLKFSGSALKYLWIVFGGVILWVVQHLMNIANAFF